MRIDYVVCPANIADKIESKHNVTAREARQALPGQGLEIPGSNRKVPSGTWPFGNPRIRFAEKGYIEGNDVYVAFGRTFGGRYLAVFFVHKPTTATAIIISARDMSRKERRSYGRK